MLMLWVPTLSGAVHEKELAVEIVRCADDHHQPGWVEARSWMWKARSERSMTHQAKE